MLLPVDCVWLLVSVFIYSLYCFVFFFLERVIVVAEYYPTSLHGLIEQKKLFGLDLICHISRSVLAALDYLHSNNIVHRNLHLRNVLLSPDGCVKLSAYGMYFMTRSGTLVSFPIGWGCFLYFFFYLQYCIQKDHDKCFHISSCPKYLAPEVLLMGFGSGSQLDSSIVDNDELALLSSKSKSDIWSFGIMLLEMAIGAEILPQSRTKLCSTLRKVLSWIYVQGSAVERIVQEADTVVQWKVMVFSEFNDVSFWYSWLFPF